ncbi:hypothetical protein ACIA4M_06755 [Lactobacillus delbrueckii subsp. bulgaricus]
MAKIKGANAVLDVMYKWGIDHLYGFPGEMGRTCNKVSCRFSTKF